MSRDMKRKFNFINITGNAFTEIPHTDLHVIEPDAERRNTETQGTSQTLTTEGNDTATSWPTHNG
jgi:hypothetical protein